MANGMDNRFKLMIMALMDNKDEAVVLLEYKMAKAVVNRRIIPERKQVHYNIITGAMASPSEATRQPPETVLGPCGPLVAVRVRKNRHQVKLFFRLFYFFRSYAGFRILLFLILKIFFRRSGRMDLILSTQLSIFTSFSCESIGPCIFTQVPV